MHLLPAYGSEPLGSSVLPVQQAARESASLKNCFLLKLIYSLSPCTSEPRDQRGVREARGHKALAS